VPLTEDHGAVVVLALHLPCNYQDAVAGEDLESLVSQFIAVCVHSVLGPCAHATQTRCDRRTRASFRPCPSDGAGHREAKNIKDKPRLELPLEYHQNCLPSAWKHSHTRVSSHSFRFWLSLRNGCSTTSSQVRCEKEKHTSSTPWCLRCLFATLAHATPTRAAFRVTGTSKSKPRMSVHVSLQRLLHGSGIAGSARCQSRLVPITARCASGRSRFDEDIQGSGTDRV
jgi:hypothetical protein